ncbi:MAG: PTS sugar transporter subunit IIC [Candidatus Eiseniibacteriota bacterium]|nr:MAG: PTS sugar transporter subunit IIC [Candidatus Eisenbacteria bacterium]
MLREILVLCFAAGVCALDTTAAWQLMLSQPLVSGTIAGFIVGSPETGVFVGVLLQLLWSGSMPLGSRPMPDAPVGTATGVWFAAALVETGGVSLSFSNLAGLLVALCVALAGRSTIVWERELNCRLMRRLRMRLSSGRNVNVELTQALSMTMAFFRGFLLCVLAVGVLSVLVPVLGGAGGVVGRDYKLVLLLVQGLGIGVLVSVFARGVRGRLPAFAGGVALALLIRNLAG